MRSNYSTSQNATSPSQGGHGEAVVHWVKSNQYTTITTILILSLATFILRVKKFRETQIGRSRNLPKLPHNNWFGTIPAMVSLIKGGAPQDAHPQGHMTLLQREHNLDHIFFMETWPASGFTQMIVTDPAVATQIVHAQPSLPKHPEVRRFIEHLAGPTSLIFTEGQEWKKARSLFNPGFAPSHLLTLVPSIVDDTQIFSKILDQHATSGEVFQVEELAAKLTIDIMAHVVLDHSLNSMISDNELVNCFRTLSYWTAGSTDINPLAPYNPIMWWMQWYYSRRMTAILGGILEERYATKNATDSRPAVPGRRGKPAIDLALDEHAKHVMLASNEDGDGEKDKAGALFATFKVTAIDSMKSFLFAGHDTSSSTICFIYHCLTENPKQAERLRQELDEVFGSEAEEAGNKLKQEPSLVNKLPYTTAVIKEVLRLYPPASTVRNGVKGVDLVYKGETYPTENAMVWIVSHAIHRRPDLFPSPDSFIPERFLPVSHPLFYKPQVSIQKDTWRPFEKGARDCIGQELAMLEMKIMIVMTAREFEVKEAYELWDEKIGRKVAEGQGRMWGSRAYQVLMTSAKPKDGFPATVRRR